MAPGLRVTAVDLGSSMKCFLDQLCLGVGSSRVVRALRGAPGGVPLTPGMLRSWAADSPEQKGAILKEIMGRDPAEEELKDWDEVPVHHILIEINIFGQKYIDIDIDFFC